MSELLWTTKTVLEERYGRTYRVTMLKEDGVIGPTVRRVNNGSAYTVAFEYDVNLPNSWQGHIDYTVSVMLDDKDWWRVTLVLHSARIETALLEIVLRNANGLAAQLNKEWKELKESIFNEQ